jgi:hypothetical protein
MTATRAALFALLTLWGVGDALPAAAQADDDAAVEQAESTPVRKALTNRVWVRTDTELPGSIRIFLSDGTLVSDSCWETHRLSPWQMTSDTALSWNEDGMEIAAEIVEITQTDLVLRLALAGGQSAEERYAAAGVPYVCPDMPA